MSDNIIKRKVLSSLGWKYLERGSVQGISFIVSLILARLLVPDDYGLIILIAVFVSLANVFVQSGFNIALIQRKDIEDEDYSSVFVVSFIVALFIYLLLFASAPFLAKFYGKDQFVPILRVLSLTLFFGAANSIQNAILIRKLQFKKLFLNSLGAILGSGAIGICMAYAGFGVWALVGQQLSNSILVFIIMWFTIKWRPRFVVSKTRIKILLSFGWKILTSSLIDSLYNEIYNLTIGKMYASNILAYYNKGQEFPKFIVINIDSSIQSVMLPIYATHQDNKQEVKSLVQRTIITSSFLVFPLLVGLACVAEPLVKILLTDKWLPCVPFIQLYCAAYFFHPINAANTQAINALGRSDIYLKINVVKKCIALGILGVSLPFGVYAIAFGSIINGIVFVLLNTLPNQKLLNYKIKEQCKDILPCLLLSAIMGIAVYSIQFFCFSAWLTLIVQVIIGALVYVGFASLFKVKSFCYLLNIAKDLVRKKGT